MWKVQRRIIKAKGLDGEQAFSARALGTDEINELVLLAQEKDWLGNSALVDFLVACALSDQDRELVSRDRFLGFNVGREVWIITLQSLAAHVRKTLRVSGLPPTVPKIKRYRYADLVTPGFLTFVKRDMDSLNIEGFSRHMLKTLVLDVELGGKRLSKPDRRGFIDKNFDSLVGSILEAIGLDKGLESKMPKEVLSTPAQRFYVALRLAATLDWVQYQSLVYAFNQALGELLFCSNQLGGINSTRGDVDLTTGLPLFPELIRPVKAVPPEVVLHLLHDVIQGNLGAFSDSEVKVIRRCFDFARFRIGDALGRGDLIDADQRISMLFDSFEEELNKSVDIIRKSCFVYMAAYMDYSDRKIAEEIERHKDAVQYLTIPDGYVLVEGPSDEICFRKFIRLMARADMIVRVEGCGGKAEVVRRARDLRSKEKHAGAIVAILDSDATKEFEDLRRLFLKDRYAKVIKLKCGAIEDLFAPGLHCKAVNAMFQDGELVKEGDFVASHDAAKVLGRVLFEKKKVKLDKRLHAKELLKEVRGVENIPADARRIVETALEVVKRRCDELPRVASRLYLMSSRKVFLENLASKLREAGSDDDDILDRTMADE